MFRVAYCSNVHAGSSLVETRDNLDRYTREVKAHFAPQQPMGVGLWLSENSASQMLADTAAADAFQAFLQDAGIVPFTFNGFPFGNFHQRVVKHDVYRPTWFEPSRAEYTWDLVRLIHRFAPAGWEASISTLPIAWGSPPPTDERLFEAAQLIRDLARSLSRWEDETGRLVYLCIEPEPGCVLQHSDDLVRFFESYLLPGGDEQVIRRHIRICHDVCHGVVMGESQRDMLSKYHQAGLLIGKVQISSAVVVDFDTIETSDRADAVAQLSSFAEDRYLHQTTIQRGSEIEFYEDLPRALETLSSPRHVEGVWRIHFHIPVYLRRFGLLNASQADILECVAAIRDYSDVQHFEVETYAWNVLPAELRQDNLAVGIAEELKWFAALAAAHLD